MSNILKCNNCSFTIEEDELHKDKTAHACWLDQKKGNCKIEGNQREGHLLLTKELLWQS